MKAAIAVRVSPRPQENVRYSPEIQEQLCRDWCAREDHEVVTVVQDILVSGGASDRFASIFTAIANHSPDLFVVSDLSRWTRDKPSRFWAIKALLEDQGVQLVSVSEPWLGAETPFSDTVTTATVEMNYQERLRLKAKTSAGVRKAWAAGKRWGHAFGWTWHPRERHDHDDTPCPLVGEWTQDIDLIRGFYQDWLDGMPATRMGQKYRMHDTNVHRTIVSPSQRDVVPDLWERAQTSRTYRSARQDARRSSIYRGLLICPFCGSTLIHAAHWGHYRCFRTKMSPHGWYSLSTSRHVTPVVQELLGRLHTPALPVASSPQAIPERDWQKELDRLSMAWVKGRLSDNAYERAVSDIEKQRQETAHPPPGEVMEFVRDLSYLDLDDQRPETGNAANAVLRELIDRIELSVDRVPTVIPHPWITDFLGDNTIK